MSRLLAYRRILGPLLRNMVHLLEEGRVRNQESETFRAAEGGVGWDRGGRVWNYLLSLHGRIAIDVVHISVHLLWRRTVRGGGVWLDLWRIHAAAIISFLSKTMSHRVVRRRHSAVTRLLGDALWWELGACWRNRCGTAGGSFGMRGGFLSRHDINEEIEHVRLG